MTATVTTPPARPLALDPREALTLARRAWTLPCGDTPLRVRGALPADLALVARMHGRCSADTLLQRYLMGGRAPSLAIVTSMLAQPMVMVARAPGGELVAMVTAMRSPMRVGSAPVPARALSFGLVVEDAWQRRGIGRALAAHLAASAHLLGVRELVADTAATTLPLRRVLDDIGLTTGSRTDLGSRLRTRLDVSNLAGLGPMRDMLAS